jgi:cellulose synthase/poly-beta-1,6-N-acetylglucosamine synthase-like glycosyltransferase
VMQSLEFIFWGSLLLVGYTYAVYPLLMSLFGRGSPPIPVDGLENVPDDGLPRVDVLIAAYNEEAHVVARMHNLLEQSYPPDRLRVLLGSDGSSDATVARARAIGSDRIEVHDLPRRGKASVLNDLMAQATAPIVVLSDANTAFDRDAIRQLVGAFADPEVGAVVGELRLLDASGDNEDSTYWSLERRIKAAESCFGGLLGANGAIYAVRRELFEPLPADTIVDDFVVAMRISAAGYRVLYEPRAVAIEDTPPGMDVEFRRRIRIGTGNYQAFFRYPEFLTRTSWATRFTYLSHKVLRWFTPHLLIVALLCSAALSAQPLYRTLCGLQVAGYVGAVIAFLLRERIALPRIVRVPVFLLALNAAFAAAFWRYLSGVQGGTWSRTAR